MDTDRPDVLSPRLAAQLACILEATARKPGNVHRFADFDDTSFLDYLLAATAIGEPFNDARTNGVGPTVLAAVSATQGVVATNTNLGMILLIAPLATVPDEVGLKQGIGAVLETLTWEDARYVYRAIRLARPGGLGTVPMQDIANEPTVTLLGAMQLAADRDLVARQYTNRYAEVFDVVLPVLQTAPPAGLETAIVTAFLTLLARCPDSLIARKRGMAVAAEASRRAGDVLAHGPVEIESQPIEAFDRWLREDGHARNPGTTADLVATALYVALREGMIPLPRPAGLGGWTYRRP
jgi:triphosphoribosyl-dephospho-CoA synthase